MVTYLPVFLLLGTASLLALLFFLGATFLGSKKPTLEKMLPFECGSSSTGSQDAKPSVAFYLTAILFVVFDVEAVFVYPWAVQFKQLGGYGLVSMVGFLTVIGVALAYVWKKGALEWKR